MSSIDKMFTALLKDPNLLKAFFSTYDDTSTYSTTELTPLSDVFKNVYEEINRIVNDKSLQKVEPTKTDNKVVNEPVHTTKHVETPKTPNTNKTVIDNASKPSIAQTILNDIVNKPTTPNAAMCDFIVRLFEPLMYNRITVSDDKKSVSTYYSKYDYNINGQTDVVNNRNKTLNIIPNTIDIKEILRRTHFSKIEFSSKDNERVIVKAYF